MAHYRIFYEVFLKAEIMQRRQSFVSPCENQSIYTLTLKQEAYSFEFWYRDTGENFRKDFEAIFLKIDLEFLE